MKIDRDTKQEFREPVIVPLVNIVFLLLIFFMLVGRIAPFEALDVAPPVSGAGEQTADRPDPVVLIAADRRLALDEEEMEEDLLLSTIARLFEEDPSLTVRIKADAALEADQLIRLMESLQKLGITRLLLLTERPES
jgi:biopolymer transport protein ExbD